MGHLAEQWTDEQREAVAVAYLDRGIRPASAVVAAAAAGELTYDGQRLEPFAMPEGTVRSCYLRVRNRRAGKVASDVAKLPARDAAEALKRALAAMAEQEISHHRRKRIGTRDPELVRQWARAAREIAAIPDATDPRSVKPGEKIPGTQRTAGGKTTGGLAGSILQAAGQVRPRSNAREVPAQNAPSTQHAYTEQGSVRTPAQNADQHADHDGEAGPGSWASDQVGAMQGA